ncbi:MAG: VCBS repeat-containing protein [Bacteroides cellulosilyticus]|uniref:RHS repeat-associated core domain-containing protein n=1 Tax=Bacteroides cellulosilyticus TaxID=246787 RepID=UPI0029555AD6|nr:RHS repeat-associated core domain-containing protein [Bacteroides cellulosilyticus]MBS5698648.1 VCBS repeat-containing protein [Bacteroides cellulosilyticus]MDV7045470.1 RHS repeat-associated core domain-containing protein [Bacteroides cellulosilyticus]
MKRRIFFILVLLCTLSGYAQISVGRDSLVIDPLKDEFMQEADEDGLYKIVTEVNELSSEDSAVRSEVLSLDAPLLKPPLKPLDPFEPLEPLDPLLPAPPSLPELPSTVEIDRAKAVGEIPIQSRIENGSLTYSVPIEIYGGKNGHQPALALSYNSLMGNSIAGYGWCIGGLSYISICNSNYYYDGSNAKPASLDKNSAYSLDGSRLIKISETSSQIDYQTEHGNVKVTFYAPSGKYYFDVWYPDGKKVTLGYPTNTSAQITYPITKSVDAFGGYIDFTYLLDNNVYYVTEIKYGSNSTQYGAVKFTYQTRSDVQSSYIAGRLMKDSKLLSKIDTYYQSSMLLSTYTLSYDTSIYSFLSKISLKSNAKEVNPLMFYYGGGSDESRFQTSTAFLETYFANSKAPDLILHKGKFNSLTRSEGLVAYPNFESYGITAYDKKGNYQYGSKYDPAQNLLVYKNLGDYLCSPVKIQAGNGFQKLYPVDIDGDGNDELVRINYWLHDQNSAKVDITTYDKNMTARNASFLLEGTFAEGSRQSAVPRLFITGDFNGDGKMELVAVSGNKLPKGETRTWSRTTMFNLELRTKIYDQTPFLFDYFKDALFAVDYNGDGRTDICLINGIGTYIYSYQGGAFVQIAYTSGIKSTDISGASKRELLVEDINGDGLTDFLLGPKKNDYWIEMKKRPCGECSGCRGEIIDDPIIRDPFLPNNGGKVDSDKAFEFTTPCIRPISYPVTHYNSTYKTWTALLATGSGFVSSTFEFLSNSDTNYQFLFHDLNGDKLPDLAVKSGTQISVHLNQNGKLNTVAESAKVTVDSDSHFITGTIGDGYSCRTSQLLSIKDATVTPISFTRNDARGRMLTGMINSYGVIEKFDYENLTNGNMYWTTSGYSTTFPYNKLYMDINVVSNTYSFYGNTYLSSKSYYYNDAVTHRQGLGFRGFRKITMHDNMKGTQVELTFDPMKFGVITQLVNPMSEASYYYTVSIASNKVAKIALSNKTEKDKLKNTTVSSNYIYDTYGNVTQETVTYSDGLIVTTNNSYHNTNDASTYRIGFLYDQVTTKTRDGSTWVDRKYIPVYSNQLPVVKVHYANNKAISQVSYSYQDGLVSQESLREYASTTNLITKYEYDSYGRVIKKIDPLGLIETYTYNSKGQLSSMKNHKNQETSFNYDDFGRKVKSVKPDGVIETTSFSWATSPVSALWLSTVSVTGSPASQTYYDAWGREVRTGKQRFDGNYVYTDNVYDEKGSLAKVSMPFKGSTPAQWNVYTYDAYDRVVSLKYASGKEDTFSYSNTSITSVVDGVSKTEKYNASGDIISVTDPAGTTTYNYRPDGQMISVVAPGQITTTFGYDDFGRQTTMNDPSLGIIRYAYDTMGNVAQETDANGNVTKKTYDNFHRLIKKEVAGQTINYGYNADNLIESEVSSNGTSKAYTYDALMRLNTLKETNVDGKWLKKTFTHTNGCISDLTYASNIGNIVTENYTYSYGNLSEVKLNNSTSIWKLTSENALGLTTGVNTGILTRTYSYDANGAPTGRVVKNGSTVIQNSGYNFNAKTGNLNWRKDNVRNIQENFGYDNLNRLTSFAGKTATYSNNGNITNISNVGTFTYNAEKPYAIALITPYGTEVPLREQQITYNVLRRPETITENGYVATFTYNGEGNRVKMNLKKNNQVQLNRYYWGNQYEFETGVAGSKEILYLGGDAYSAAAVYVKEGSGAWVVYYLCRDYLGSITHTVNSSGGLKQELSYDAWGRLRNPANQTLYAVGAEPTLFLGRGYTGHEHLTAFGLINMNARLYDPVIGRFLSPDPQLQEPYSSQNYNRYSYCLNNPLKYNDPNGEFIFGIFNFVKDLFVNTFIKSWSKGINAWTKKENWRSTINAFKLDLGLFKGGFWDVVSRLTWQLVQTGLGNLVNQVLNTCYLVNEVNYFDGAVVIDSKIDVGGMTLSNYILGPPGFKPDFRDHLFVHEYGHYLQSKKLGPAYLFVVAKPSLLSSTFDKNNHGNRWYETHASKLAAKYFDKKYGTGAEAYQNYLNEGKDPYKQEDIFNVDVFKNGGSPAYHHPRGKEYGEHPVKPKWNGWQDIFFF